MENEKLSRIAGLRLLAIKEGVECGAIREVVMDVEKKTVDYLVLDTGRGCFGFCVLPCAKIAGMGKDFAITASSEFVSSIWKEETAMDLAYTDSDLIGARVVSSSGDVVGKIVDFEFMLTGGEIVQYIMEDGAVLPGECIVTLSRGIVFIDSDKAGDIEGYSDEMPSVEEEPISEILPTQAAAISQVDPEIVSASDPVNTPKTAVVSPPAQEAVVPEPAAAPTSGAAASETPLASRLAALRNRSPIAANVAASGGNTDTKSYFEKRRAEYVIGKTVKQRISAADGTVLADAGDTVTSEMIEKITAADKLTELTMGVN